ncbi:MAG: phosphatidylserine/phosphatidylglycerophosphate/cardiolipin synthase family protein [Cytophagia bacterium]|jgi:hypothetical protein|nr:phosphatidylserine/phosphatidylglycerophosphate/cardiolipin synthase family protein [Cytophagia bacterium]
MLFKSRLAPVLDGIKQKPGGKDLLGFGNKNLLLKTREIERDLNNLLQDADSGEQVWLISPYVTMDKLSSLKRNIADAASTGVNINFVVRDEAEQVNPAVKHLSEAISNGLHLYAYKRLHAKVYWFENSGCIITSANLVDGSFEASTEIGLGIPAGRMHDDIREWITEVIEPGLRDVSKPSRKTKSSKRSTQSGSGHCIRCASAIRYNIKKPYCREHYNSWSKYSNPDYEEIMCHSCGKTHKTSMAKPVCYTCYKKNPYNKRL